MESKLQPEFAAMMPGDWGMYSTQMDCTEAKDALDRLGELLVCAVRNGSTERIKKAVTDIKDCQMKYREFGAADTEGRHALQDLMAAACKDTLIDVDKLQGMAW